MEVRKRKFKDLLRKETNERKQKQLVYHYKHMETEPTQPI